ncbi:hypothetical protein [Actinomadura madurae]|uniref:hypothetical protein n=1 Tax=Actinomadura madurae TaxID=1993 RepID=UPI0020D236A7|nr:hypothetical protein [Actinomadura madurae]MCQ0020203.1 hypothetical protein [Actinomadura madurae]
MNADSSAAPRCTAASVESAPVAMRCRSALSAASTPALMSPRSRRQRLSATCTFAQWSRSASAEASRVSAVSPAMASSSSPAASSARACPQRAWCSMSGSATASALASTSANRARASAAAPLLSAISA